LKSQNLISEPNRTLTKIYALKKIPRLTVEDVPLESPSAELLISNAKLGEIAAEFKDPEITVLGKRAIAQISKKLKMGQESGQADKATSNVKEGKPENGETSISTPSSIVQGDGIKANRKRTG
jgi:hypothetical protein